MDLKEKVVTMADRWNWFRIMINDGLRYQQYCTFMLKQAHQ
jgi:hypothetical protein